MDTNRQDSPEFEDRVMDVLSAAFEECQGRTENAIAAARKADPDRTCIVIRDADAADEAAGMQYSIYLVELHALQVQRHVDPGDHRSVADWFARRLEGDQRRVFI